MYYIIKYTIMTMRILLTILIILASSISQLSGNTNNYYKIKNLNVENGLSSNYVVDITQDNEGCIWAATEYGVSKFDGKEFYVYKMNNSDICSNELNTILYIEEDNSIWIGSQRKGISILNLDNLTFSSLNSYNGLITNDITDLKRAKDGGIWISHYHLGIDYYNMKDKSVISYNTSNVKDFKGRMWTSCDDGKGHLYVGHENDGLSIIDIKDKTCKNFKNIPGDEKSIPCNSVRAIHIDSSDRVWIGTDNGLSLFNPQTEEFINFHHINGNEESLLSNIVYDITQTKDGKIWICTYMGGISILDMQNNSFITPDNVKFTNIKATKDDFGLSSPNAKSILEDIYGNIWIANYRGGLDFISYANPVFNLLPYSYKNNENFIYKQVWGINTDTNNMIFLGGEDEIAIFENNTKTQNIKIGFPYSINKTHVNTIYYDKNNSLWLGMYMSGVLRYNIRSNSIENISNNFSNLDVRCFTEHNNKLMIGTESGLFSFSNNSFNEENEINSQLSDNKIHGIIYDNAGKLWLGTYGKGIVIFNKDNKLIYNLNTSNGLCSNAVCTFYKDKKGGLWVGTRNGLIHFPSTEDPSKYCMYFEKDGIENEHIRAIHEDLSGNIWFSTNSGISMFDINTKTFKNYNYNEGVPRGDFMDGSVCMTNDGTLYFGSQNGVCYFNPKNIKESESVSPIAFTNLTNLSGITYTKGKENIIPLNNDVISLSYKENNIRITFNVTNYTQSRQVEYIYTMEGLNNSWYNTEGENQVTFRNLPYGKYIFKVNAKLRNQDWNDSNIKTLTIKINPPIWLTWYAKLLYFLIFCYIIFLIIRFYKHKIQLEGKLSLEHKLFENEQKLNNERLRFYTNITHELRTPLTLIIGPLEDLLSDKSLSSKYLNKISIIHDSANKLLSLINQILEFRKVETQNKELCVLRGNISKLVKEIGFSFKELSQNKNVDIEINICKDEMIMYFDPNIITIIINNLMSNAIKYTQEGKIILSLSEEEINGINHTLIKVSDTGYGISEDALPHIFERYYQAKGKHQASGTGIGLSLVKSLADIHEAEITVDSKLNIGSVFTLSLISDNSYPNAKHKEIASVENSHEAIKKDNTESGIQEDEDNKPVLLIVEDNDDIREYIKSSLDEVHTVLTASNGKEGWEIAKNKIPSIIITDIMMPVMDGFALCKKVKEDMRTSHIPVIMLTAKDTIQDKEEGYAAGADSFITKPFSARLLQKRIDNLLEGRKKLAGMVATRTVSAIGTNTKEDLKDLEKTAQVLNKLDREFLEKVNGIIEDNLSMEKMDVAFIADKMCMSHSTLYRKIKGLTDMSVNEFVRKIKMKKSSELLSSGEYTISEVSDLTGFSSVAYFRQCFKDEYGVAPTEYLKQQK